MSDAMSEKEVEDLLIETSAIMEGHFLLTSGLHSPRYVEKFNVLQKPVYTEKLCRAMAEKFKDANIETVVVYDPNTGDKAFEVIDTTTGLSVPNYPRPNNNLLDDTSIDISTGIASNSNIGQNWKVVVLKDALNNF